MLKVVHIKRTYLPISETFVYSYLKNMTGIESHVVADKQKNIDLFPFERRHILTSQNRMTIGYGRLVHKLTRSPKTGFAVLPRSPFAERTCRTLKPDVIHAHGGYDGFNFVFLKNRLRVPFVTTFYGRDIGAGSKHPYWRKAYSVLFRMGDLFLVEGPAMKQKLLALGCPVEKVREQRIGVDLKRFSRSEYGKWSDTDRVVVLMCGRMVEKKGLEYGIRAFSKVHSRFPNTELRIIGGGPKSGELKRLVSSLELNNSVKMLGYMSHGQYEVESRATHIFVQPSVTAKDGDSEGGAPTTLLEMQAMGVPIVSTYHDDIPHVVVEGETALLAEERDIDGLAGKIKFLVENPQIWGKMGAKGREHVEEKHDIRRLAKQLEEIYEQLAGGGRNR